MLLEILIIAASCIFASAIIRNLIVRKPLRKWSAAITAVLISSVLSFTYFHVELNTGNPSPKVSPFWWLAAFASYRILRRDRTKSGRNLLQDVFLPPDNRKKDEVLSSDDKRAPLSREEMIGALQTMLADPQTSPEKRAWAQDRLARFKKSRG